MDTKVCFECKIEKPVTEYNKGTNGAKYLPRCKPCHSAKMAADYKAKWFKYQVRLKRALSKKMGLEFDLTEDYLKSIWTPICPVFKVQFTLGDKSHPHSPALDRIDPRKGYVKGNVKYICARANRIKYDATPEELKMILDYMTKG